MDIITLIIHTGALAVLGIADIRRRCVSLLSLLIFFGGAFTWSIISGGFNPEQMLLGLSPAIVLLVLKKTMKLGIGGGDIAVLAIMGITLGFEKSVEAVFLASLICAVFSLIKIILKKADRKSRTAFIPFMGAGVVLAGILG